MFAVPNVQEKVYLASEKQDVIRALFNFMHSHQRMDSPVLEFLKTVLLDESILKRVKIAPLSYVATGHLDFIMVKPDFVGNPITKNAASELMNGETVTLILSHTTIAEDEKLSNELSDVTGEIFRHKNLKGQELMRILLHIGALVVPMGVNADEFSVNDLPKPLQFELIGFLAHTGQIDGSEVARFFSLIETQQRFQEDTRQKENNWLQNYLDKRLEIIDLVLDWRNTHLRFSGDFQDLSHFDVSSRILHALLPQL